MRHTTTLLAALLLASAQAQMTYDLLVEDDQFNPPFLSINAGDHVHIMWALNASVDHSFTQVSQDTWNVNGTVPQPGGFNLGAGTDQPGTDFTITPMSDVWYVCQFHASMGMKGTITVFQTGMEEPIAQTAIQIAAQPGNAYATVLAPAGLRMSVDIMDLSGRTLRTFNMDSERVIQLGGLPQGLYMARFRNMDMELLAEKKFVVSQ